MKTQSIISIILLFIAVNLSAQKFGIQAGYVHITEKTDKDIYAFPKEVSGFQVGPVSEVELFSNFDLRYGVLYTLLKADFDGLLTGKYHYNGHFVDVPLHIQFSFPFSNALKVFAFGGPDFNFSLVQKTAHKTTALNSELVVNYDRHDTDTDNDKVKDVTRFDLKLGLGAGIQFGNLQLRAGYDWGMLDLNNTKNTSLKSNRLTASVAYTF